MIERPWNCKSIGTFGIFLLASLLYIWGVSPTIYWRDSSEFVTVVHTLGISHPAGSPTYSLLAKLATFLPIGSIALRVNLFSALPGALTVALVFSLLYETLEDSPPIVRLCAALSGGLFLTVSVSFWRFAEVAEVYMLQDFFMLALIILLLRARKAVTHAGSTRLYWLFAFLYGLSAGVHATTAFFAPAFLIFIGFTKPRMFRGKALAFLAFFFLLGLAVYLYLPLRSLSNPVYDWGDPQTFQQFVAHITDRKDASTILASSTWKLPYQIRVYLANLSNEFSTLGIALGLLGCGAIFSRDTRLGLLLGLIYLGNVAFFIRSWTASFGFLPSHIIFAMWIGFGVHACLGFLIKLYQRQTIRIPHTAVSFFLIGAVLVTLGQTFARHLASAHQSGNYSAELYGKQILEQLPSDAILFSSYSWFPLRYLQHVEQRRPDATIVPQSDVFFPEYFEVVSTKRFPNIKTVTSVEPEWMSTTDYFWRLVEMNQNDHPLFWDPDPYRQALFDENLLPKGFLFAFHPDKKIVVTPQVLQDHHRLLASSISRILPPIPDDEASSLLVDKMNFIGLHFKRRGLFDEAVRTYQTGLSVKPNDKNLHTNYGVILMKQKKFSEALEHFNVAYNESPVDPSINYNVGVLFLRWGNNAQAAHFLERTLSSGNVLQVEGVPQGDIHAQLGLAYSGLRRFQAARRHLQAALDLYATSSAPIVSDAAWQKRIDLARKHLQRLEQKMPDDSPERHEDRSD